MHVDRAGGLDTQPHLIAAHLEHGHDDLVPDHDALIGTSSEHEHGVLPPWQAAPWWWLQHRPQLQRVRVTHITRATWSACNRERSANAVTDRRYDDLRGLERASVHDDRSQQVDRRVVWCVAERDHAEHRARPEVRSPRGVRLRRSGARTRSRDRTPTATRRRNARSDRPSRAARGTASHPHPMARAGNDARGGNRASLRGT